MTYIKEGLGNAWMFHNHYNQNLPDYEEGKNDALAQEEKRRRAINPWLGSKPHELHEDVEDLDEGTSGSAWMFYHHYNPDLLKAMNKLIVGNKIEDVVDELLEKDNVEAQED